MAKKGLKGDVGSYAHTTMDDGFWIVGTEPNTYPTARIEPTGKELVSLASNTATGITNGKTAVPRYEEIDNSSDHHGGTFSFVCMNNFNVDSGGGGINLNTCGNVSIFASGGLANIIAPLQTSIASDLIELASTNAIIMSGKQLYVESQKTTFENNVFFNKNAVVNGGLFVNGELCATHITAPLQTNFTGGPLAGGRGKPLQVFAPMGTIISGIITSPTVQITSGTVVKITTLAPLRIGTMSPHIHAYQAPGFTGEESMEDFSTQAAKAFSDQKFEAKPTLLNDMSLDDLRSEMIKMVEKMITDYLKDLIIG